MCPKQEYSRSVWHSHTQEQNPKIETVQRPAAISLCKRYHSTAALHTGFQNKTNNICSPPPHLQSLKTKTYHTYSFSNHTENINLTILTWMSKLSMWCLQNIIQKQTKSIHQWRIIFLFVIIYALFLDLYSVGFLTYISSLCKVRFMRGNI